eukprot:1567016-Amphidinium_carterae.1
MRQIDQRFIKPQQTVCIRAVPLHSHQNSHTSRMCPYKESSLLALKSTIKGHCVFSKSCAKATVTVVPSVESPLEPWRESLAAGRTQAATSASLG